MIDSGVNFRQLVDPWGHPYYVKYSVESEYGDATRITYQPDARVQTGTPVTRKLAWVRIMSPGLDGQPNTPDDFPVASFSRDIAASGSSIRNVVPRPTSLSAVIVPSCSSSMRLHRDNPSPVPSP